jgi:transcriptional regulator with XRE-family HTH domain
MGFRENLREALDYSGLEQKELAHRANVKLRSIENYLRENASIPMADKAVQIAQALGVTVEYLVTGKNSPDTYIDPEIRKLARVIKKLPKNKQPIVIKNAIHLAETLSK